ncbi:MAG TPA: glycosyltransferase family 9 protein [Nevskiaceae bacterium]
MPNGEKTQGSAFTDPQSAPSAGAPEALRPGARIAVVRLSALGDVVLAVPAVRALARRYPQADIHWFTSGALAQILRGLPGNVRVRPIAKPRGVRDYLRLAHRWRRERFDALLAMQASLRANLLYPLLHAPIKIGFDRPRSRELHGCFINRRIPLSDRHLLEQFMAFAVAAGVTDTRVEWRLALDEEAQARMRAATGGRPYWLLNPCASKPERNWPVARNVELAHRMQGHADLAIAICSGPAPDERRAAAAVAAAVPGAIDLGGKTSLRELVALIAGARALVSPDSGPVHIARAFEVPVVGLYADAHCHKSGPWHADAWTVDVHDEAVRRIAHRDPAAVPWDFRIHDPRAMELIGVDAVAGKLTAALA